MSETESQRVILLNLFNAVWHNLLFDLVCQCGKAHFSGIFRFFSSWSSISAAIFFGKWITEV